jgi:HK97 family phage portal protein
MSLISWISRKFGFLPENREVADSLQKRSFIPLNISDAGISVDEESALRLSAVWACIRLLSELPASLPIEVYEEHGKSRFPVEHPAKYTLLNPSNLCNRFTWHETMNAWQQGWGNAYSLIDISEGVNYAKLIHLHPSGVEPVLSQGRLFYKVRDRLTGITGTFFRDEIIHYKMLSIDGINGKSPIRIARENIALGLAAERYGAKFFRRGGNLKAVIETEGHMSDAEFKEWKRRWDKYYQGDAGDHQTPILEYGLKYKQLGVNPEDAQFIASRKFQLNEICRIFNVPPPLIADLERATFSNIEHLDLQFVKYTLRADLRRKEMELEDKLIINPKERGRIRIRFNIDGLLRGDLATLTDHIVKLTNNGTMVRNEGRALLNLNPLPGLDTPLNPANITGKTNEKTETNA